MKSLLIKNYKNLKELQINSLANINLIVGKNNVGKSTLLEAISIFTAGGSVQWLKQLLAMRGINTNFLSGTENVIEKEIEAFGSLYHNNNIDDFPNNSIAIKLNLQKEAIIGISVMKIVEKKKDGITFKKLQLVENADLEKYLDTNLISGLVFGTPENQSLYLFESPKNPIPIVEKQCSYKYVKTSEITSNNNPRLFDRITLSPLQQYLIESLHIIEPRIETINFLKDDTSVFSSTRDNRVPFVVFYGSKKRYKLSSMGDSINRI